MTAPTPDTGNSAPPDTGSTPPPDTGTPPSPDTGNDTTDWRAEAEKWQALARKHEGKSKDNAAAAKELERVRREAMSDQERAVAAARDEAAATASAEVTRRLGGRLVVAEIRAAVGNRLNDESVTALVERLDLSGFINDDGEVDRQAVAKFAQSVAPEVNPSPAAPFDLGQGARQSSNGDPFANDPLLKSLKGKLGIAT